MYSDSFDFSKLIYPADERRFFAEFWEKKPLIIQRKDSSYYRDILTESDIEHILGNVGLPEAVVQLNKSGEYIETKAANGVADREQLVHQFKRGATIIFRGLHRFWPRLSRLCRNMEFRLSHKFQTNVYLTPPGKQAFQPHYDTHDVFVLQCGGSKRWKIYTSPIALPVQYNKSLVSRDELDSPEHEFELHEGDLVYIPRGYVHEAVSDNHASLHITLGMLSMTWADAVRCALEYAEAEDVEFRRSIPIDFFNNDASLFESSFKDILDRMHEGTRSQDVLDQIRSKIVCARTSPLGRSPNLFSSPNVLSDNSIVRRAPGLFVKIETDENELRLLFNAKIIHLPRHIEECLSVIDQREQFKVEDLNGMLDKKGRQILIQSLVDEGFLELMDEP